MACCREGKARKRTHDTTKLLGACVENILSSRKCARGAIDKVKFRLRRAGQTLGICLRSRLSSTGSKHQKSWMSNTDVLDLAF
eukprot:11317479-Heterocapsa_arctica.AAC.1